MSGYYQQAIREDAAALGYIGANPRHIEAYMRLEHPTLDGLTREQFLVEVGVAIECIKVVGDRAAEVLAQSFGLVDQEG